VREGITTDPHREIDWTMVSPNTLGGGIDAMATRQATGTFVQWMRAQ
jgi:hypothetical protein